MSLVLAALSRHADTCPDHPALVSSMQQLSYGELPGIVNGAALQLQDAGVQVLAMAADNSPAWVCADLACIRASIPVVPVPHFFSPAQIAHLLHKTGVDALLTDRADQLCALFAQLSIACERTGDAIAGLQLIRIQTA
ncbi:MAG: AMP-binding protein, partial [Mariprofundus sp.]